MIVRQKEPSQKRKRDEATIAAPLHVKRQRLLETRRKLPVWDRQTDIQKAVRDNDVLVLSGETGSGKSTQLPQFLLDVCGAGKIAVTQPRRVAAITLARRVADEMGSPCGSSSPASLVGYSVRFDQSVSPSTRIKFLTEGMLLQELLRDKNLKQYSLVIVDEVHERSINVDLILGFLKQLVIQRRRDGNPLKVVVMSATADVAEIAKFFTETQQVPKTAIPSGTDDESERSWDGCSDHDEELISTSNDQISATTLHVEGRQYPVKLHYLTRPTEDVAESALHRIFSIHTKEALPGDILVFMTGQDTIQSLQKLVEDYAESLPRDVPKVMVLPLYAALSQSAQQQVFEPTPRFTRKIILSTNIAETSVTVSGVRFVVDIGKGKIRQFRNQIGMETLLSRPISKSSANQRKGRAGREAPGQCYRLYTEPGYKSLKDDNKPEILRCNMAEALLNMKARGVVDPFSFPFLTPPPREAVDNALMQLYQLGTLDDNGKISKVGLQVARLPLVPALGRAVVEAARLECLLEVIDIVACLTVKSVFLNINSEETKIEVQEARQQLTRRQGDHLTMLAVVQGYVAEEVDRKRWADARLVSHQSMKQVMAVRKQLRAQCKMSKMLSGATSLALETGPPSEEKSERIVRAFLRGFVDNMARLCPDGSYKTFNGNNTVAVHPSSVLMGRKSPLILYNELVYTSKAFVRGVSVIHAGWIADVYDTMMQDCNC